MLENIWLHSHVTQRQPATLSPPNRHFQPRHQTVATSSSIAYAEQNGSRQTSRRPTATQIALLCSGPKTQHTQPLTILFLGSPKTGCDCGQNSKLSGDDTSTVKENVTVIC